MVNAVSFLALLIQILSPGKLQKHHVQGGKVVLTNAPIAMRMGELNGLAEAIDAPIIPADATSMEDLEKLIQGATDHFGVR